LQFFGHVKTNVTKRSEFRLPGQTATDDTHQQVREKRWGSWLEIKRRLSGQTGDILTRKQEQCQMNKSNTYICIYIYIYIVLTPRGFKEKFSAWSGMSVNHISHVLGEKNTFIAYFG
jgi:hypothetical protein